MDERGGPRGAILGFSPASRRRLLRLVNSLNREKVPAEHVRFVTLTFREAPPPRVAKGMLRAIIKRYTRAWGRRGIIWKIEPQKRGAPHFHLLVIHGPAAGAVGVYGAAPSEEIGWWARNWAEVVAGDSPIDPQVLAVHVGAVRNGRPCVEIPRTWAGVSNYVGKYLGKICEGQEGWILPGRFWGVHHDECLPIRPLSADLPLRVAHRLRRAVLAWYEHQTTGRVICTNEKGQRSILPAKVAETIGAASLFVVVKPERRQWPSRRGGCNVFIDDSTYKRMIRWAHEVEGLAWDPPEWEDPPF